MGTFFDPGGLDEMDPRLLVKFNPPQINSTNASWVSGLGGSNAITNSTDYEALDLSTGAFVDNFSSRFVLTNGNTRLEYQGIEDALFEVDVLAALTGAPANGTAQVAFGKNIVLTTVTPGGNPTEYAELEQNGKDASTQIIINGPSNPKGLITLSNGDFISLFVRRVSGTAATIVNVNPRIIVKGISG